MQIVGVRSEVWSNRRCLKSASVRRLTLVGWIAWHLIIQVSVKHQAQPVNVSRCSSHWFIEIYQVALWRQRWEENNLCLLVTDTTQHVGGANRALPKKKVHVTIKKIEFTLHSPRWLADRMSQGMRPSAGLDHSSPMAGSVNEGLRRKVKVFF